MLSIANCKRAIHFLSTLGEYKKDIFRFARSRGRPITGRMSWSNDYCIIMEPTPSVVLCRFITSLF